MWKKRSKTAPTAVGAGEPRPDVYRGGFRTFQARASGPADKMRLASADIGGGRAFSRPGLPMVGAVGQNMPIRAKRTTVARILRGGLQVFSIGAPAGATRSLDRFSAPGGLVSPGFRLVP